MAPTLKQAALLDAITAGDDNADRLIRLPREFFTMSPKLREELLKEMARLSQEEQERVLAFAKTLTAGPAGKAGKDIARFAGTVDLADLEQMAAVIEEDCERIDKSEW